MMCGRNTNLNTRRRKRKRKRGGERKKKKKERPVYLNTELISALYPVLEMIRVIKS